MMEYEAIMKNGWDQEKEESLNVKYNIENTIEKGNLISNIEEVASFLGISRRTIFRLIKQEKFPKPIAVFPMGNGMKIKRIWREADLLEYKTRKRGRPLKVNREEFNKMQKIIPMYEEGKNSEQISQEIDLEERKVKSLLDEYIKSDGKAKESKILQELKEGLSQNKISQKYNISVGSVSRIVRNSKIVSMYSSGKSYTEIAQEMEIKEITVRKIITNSLKPQ